MSDSVQQIPAGYHTVTPYLVVSDAAAALDFYARAFGAEELYRMQAPGGPVMHAEIRVGDSVVMISDENPDMGALSPRTVGGSPVSLLLYVEDVDAAHARAVAAGATEVAAPEDMFWGDRFARVVDPYGHAWAQATHVEDVAPDEMQRRFEAMMAGQPG
jgi:PhnB protein